MAKRSAQEFLKASVKRAARKEGLAVDPFRAAHKIPNTTFYRLLAGIEPSKVDTQRRLRSQLEAAGVVVPAALLSA